MRSTLAAVWTVVVAIGLAGCPSPETSDAPQPPAAAKSPEAAPVAEGAPLGSVKVGDTAICAVCGESAPEEVKATLDYQGKTYAFCSEDEKAQFISDHTEGAKSGE